MASQNFDDLSNGYSDHTLLVLNTEKMKISQLNVAQLGRFQIYPDDKDVNGCSWSSLLRTPSILTLISKKKRELTKLGQRLLLIVRDSDLSLKEKNVKLEVEAEKLIKEFNELGFAVKSFKMAPNRFFNQGVSPNLLWEKPEDYINAPSFVLENVESFSARMKAAFAAIFADDVDIVTTQEMEFGESDGINFTDIHNSLVAGYESYDFVTPLANPSGTLTATYFNRNTFSDVTKDSKPRFDDLKSKLKCFGESDTKSNILFLEHVRTKEMFTVVNIHAEYPKANSEAPWKILRDLFQTIPNLIVSGDFNLTLKNESYFRNAFTDFNGKYTILQTPEPVEIGNPTYDLIITN